MNEPQLIITISRNRKKNFILDLKRKTQLYPIYCRTNQKLINSERLKGRKAKVHLKMIKGNKDCDFNMRQCAI
jgi:hypothetical protein